MTQLNNFEEFRKTLELIGKDLVDSHECVVYDGQDFMRLMKGYTGKWDLCSHNGDTIVAQTKEQAVEAFMSDVKFACEHAALIRGSKSIPRLRVYVYGFASWEGKKPVSISAIFNVRKNARNVKVNVGVWQPWEESLFDTVVRI